MCRTRRYGEMPASVRRGISTMPASLKKPQMDALAWVRKHTTLPSSSPQEEWAGRKRIDRIVADGLADLIAIGRPLIADPRLIEKWKQGREEEAVLCAYCLQGCLHRVKSGQPLGCNVNPEIGLPPLKPAESSMKVLVAGGGPAGMSAALYLTRRGHAVTLVEKEDRLGGQFALAWQAPGKEKMKDGLESVDRSLRSSGATIILGRAVNTAVVREFQPDLLVWATGAVQNIPEITDLENQYSLTSLEYFHRRKGSKRSTGSGYRSRKNRP